MASKKNSNIINQAKGLYAVVAMVIALYGVYLIAEPSLPHNNKVLGAKTLIAQGESSEGVQQGRGEMMRFQNGEISRPEQLNVNQSENSNGQVVSRGVRVFNEQVPPPSGGTEVSRDNVMFVNPRGAEDVRGRGRSGMDNIMRASDGGSMRHFGAISHFPISINPVTREMTITTPAGVKVVTVLPDQAIQNMIDHGILSKIDGHISTGSGEIVDEQESSGSAFIQSQSETDLPAPDGNIELTEKSGAPVYKIHGQKQKRFLGFIPVEIDKTVTVSADTGNIESTQIAPFDRFLDLLSL